MSELLASNDWKWRLARTIVQGVLGVFIANIDLIPGYAILDPTLRALIVAFVMAILSPVMAALGGDGDECRRRLGSYCSIVQARVNEMPL